MTEPGHLFNRRTVIASALAGAAALGVGATPASADTLSARPGIPPLDWRFDLNLPAHELFANARMYGGDYYMQSFSFDTTNRRLFIAQLHQAPTGQPAVDLNIIHMSESGQALSQMTLLGFGHGVGIAAVPEGRESYIWVEVNPNSSGWGSQLAKVKYVPGDTIDSANILPGQDITVFKPVEGAGAFTAGVDPFEDRLIIRYNDSAGVRGPAHAIRFTVFTLADANAGTFDSPVFDIVQPALPVGADGKAPVFQGFTGTGNYLYLLDGGAYPGHVPNPANVNSYLTAVDLRTGKIVQRSMTSAGQSLYLREPEGMAIGIGPGSRPRLCFGFCTLTAPDATIRRASLFYDRTMVPQLA